MGLIVIEFIYINKKKYFYFFNDKFKFFYLKNIYLVYLTNIFFYKSKSLYSKLILLSSKI